MKQSVFALMIVLSVQGISLRAQMAAGPKAARTPVAPAVAAGWAAQINNYFTSASPDSVALASVLSSLGKLDVRDPAVRASLGPAIDAVNQHAGETLVKAEELWGVSEGNTRYDIAKKREMLVSSFRRHVEDSEGLRKAAKLWAIEDSRQEKVAAALEMPAVVEKLEMLTSHFRRLIDDQMLMQDIVAYRDWMGGWRSQELRAKMERLAEALGRTPEDGAPSHGPAVDASRIASDQSRELPQSWTLQPAGPASGGGKSLLDAARAKLYALAGGRLDSGSSSVSRITSAQRLAFFGSPEFKAYVADQRARGKRVFWLKDLDKTQASGDIFTKFFHWLAANGRFTDPDDAVITRERNRLLKVVLRGTSGLTKAERAKISKNDVNTNALLIVELWKRAERGELGLDLLDFWQRVYWPVQKGFTENRKRALAAEFAPHYLDSVFPGLMRENAALAAAGADVVIVSNGDEDLVRAVAPMLMVKPVNTVGAKALYGKNGRATGKMHTYEIYDKTWSQKPQPGKVMNFYWWVNANRDRGIDGDKMVVAGFDGDSAASDGGAAYYLDPAFGTFMVDTPGEPVRAEKFRKFGQKYFGWRRGRMITVGYDAPIEGALPK